MSLGKLTKRFETNSGPCQSKIQPERTEDHFLPPPGAASSSGCSPIAMRHMTMLVMPRSCWWMPLRLASLARFDSAATYMKSG